MFQFPPYRLSGTMCSYRDDAALRRTGFPHSDIDGSLPAYRSPSRLAVRCVLPRLLVPRHPPYALSCLTLSFLLEFSRFFLLPFRLDDSTFFSSDISLDLFISSSLALPASSAGNGSSLLFFNKIFVYPVFNVLFLLTELPYGRSEPNRAHVPLSLERR